MQQALPTRFEFYDILYVAPYGAALYKKVWGLRIEFDSTKHLV